MGFVCGFVLLHMTLLEILVAVYNGTVFALTGSFIYMRNREGRVPVVGFSFFSFLSFFVILCGVPVCVNAS